MKQLLFMIVATFWGTAGILVNGPFASVLVYYMFAVMRPQYMWKWSLPPGIAWSQYVAIAAIIGTVGHLAGMFPMNGRRPPRFPGLGGVHVAFAVFCVWVFVTYPAALNKAAAWPTTVEYSKIFLMFWLSVVVVRAWKQVWALYIVATLSLIYIAYEVNFLYLVNGYLGIYLNGYGGLDNNGAGLMLAMGVPLAIYAWEGTSKWWRWFYVGMVPVLIHAVLMTYSRGAMVSLLAVVPVVLLRSRRRWQFAALTVVLALIVPVLAGNEIRRRFFTLDRYEADASANSRFDSWEAAVRMANDYPVFGVGVRNANLLSHQYGADYEGRTIHSQYFQILADTGYPGLATYAIVLLMFFRDASRSRGRLRHDDSARADQARSLINGTEGAILVFAVGAIFLSLEVFELPYLLILIMTQAGRVVACGGLLGEEAPDAAPLPIGSPVASAHWPPSSAASGAGTR